MEENTLQPGAGVNKKPQNKKTKKETSKTSAKKITSKTKSKKEVSKTFAKNSSKNTVIKKKPNTASTKTTPKKASTKTIPKKASLKKVKKNTPSSETTKSVLNKEKKVTKEKVKDKNETILVKKEKELIDINLEFDSHNLEKLIAVYKELSTSENWLKNHNSLQKINQHFESKFKLAVEKEKKKFLKGGGNEIDFFFKPDYKKNYDQITFEYRKKRRDHFKDQEAAQKINLERRKVIIEEIKKLIDQNQIDSKAYKAFRTLQESWYNTGQVPRNQSQNLWETFKHHVERFYAFLHLDREFREMDYNHNYEEKLKIIERAELLKEYPDIIKASRDLNILHKQWKNDLGPVAKEHRESLWIRFQTASKVIQLRRQEYQKNITGVMKDNLVKKENLLKDMRKILIDLPKNHNEWQNALKQFNALRENFKTIGFVPARDSKNSWKSFREVGTDFMRMKNLFYKEQKKAFNSNIKAKNELINRSKEILNSDSWENCVEEMKDIQKQWKAVEFVPRKLDNKLWKEFSNIQKIFFDRLKSGYQRLSSEQEIIFKEKNEYLEKIKTLKLKPEIETLKKEYFVHWDKWNQIGTLNYENEIKMNKYFSNNLMEQIKNAGLEKKELKSIIKDLKLSVLKNDPQQLEKEFKKTHSLISNLKAELTQLENNLEFFSNSSIDNPLFKNVEKQIQTCERKIDSAQKEYIELNKIKKNQNKSGIISEETGQDTVDH
tara:strand:+ start:31585 stop:33744 length:2160 start_codon:yes stop_codon:yes gene_type:complete